MAHFCYCLWHYRDLALEQFLPSQISSRHSKQWRWYNGWRFLLRRDEEMKAEATGLIKFPPLQQVPRDMECPENDSTSLSARHLRALPCGFPSNSFAFPSLSILLHLLTAILELLISPSLVSAIIGSPTLKQGHCLSPKPFFCGDISLRWKNAASILTKTDRFSHVRFLPAHTEAWELNSVFLQVNEHLEQHSQWQLNMRSKATEVERTKGRGIQRPEPFKPMFDNEVERGSLARSCARAPLRFYATCLFFFPTQIINAWMCQPPGIRRFWDPNTKKVTEQSLVS